MILNVLQTIFTILFIMCCIIETLVLALQYNYYKPSLRPTTYKILQL